MVGGLGQPSHAAPSKQNLGRYFSAHLLSKLLDICIGMVMKEGEGVGQFEVGASDERRPEREREGRRTCMLLAHALLCILHGIHAVTWRHRNTMQVRVVLLSDHKFSTQYIPLYTNATQRPNHSL